MATAGTAKRTNAEKTFSELSLTARHLAQVGAVFYGAGARTKLVQLSAASGWRTQQGRTLTVGSAAAAFKELSSMNVFVTPQTLRYAVAPEFQGLAIHDSIHEGTFDSLAKTVQSQLPRPKYYYSWSQDHKVLFARDLMVAFYQNDERTFSDLARATNDFPIVLDPYDAELFEKLHPQLQYHWVMTNARHIVDEGIGAAAVLEVLSPYAASQKELTGGLLEVWIDVCVARSSIPCLRSIEELTQGRYAAVRGCIDFLQGNFDAAEDAFEEGVRQLKKSTRKKKITLPGFPGVLHTLLQFRKQNSEGRARAKELLSAAKSQWNPYFDCTVDLISNALDCQTDADRPWDAYGACSAGIVTLITGWLWRWTCPLELPPVEFEEYRVLARRYRNVSLDWMADEFDRLTALATPSKTASKKNKNGKSAAANAQPAAKTPESVSLLNLVKPLEPWERSLAALETLTLPNGGAASAATTEGRVERMIWSLTLYQNGTNFVLKPFVQKVAKKGGWLKGRAISLKRLYEEFNNEPFDYLTDQDRDICRHIEEDVDYGGWRRYKDVSYELSTAALKRLVGHPLIFRGDDRTTLVELVEKEPRLIVQKNEDTGRVILSFDHLPPGNDDFQIVEDGPHRLKLLTFSEKQRRLRDIIGKKLEIPEAALDRVVGVVGPLASLMTVHSEVGGVEAAHSVEAESQPHLHLIPFQDGVRAEFHVRPFGEVGPFARPGEGGETVFADIEGKQTSARRVFDDETRLRDAVIAECSTLSEQDELEGIEATHDFYYPTALEAFELVTQLQPLMTAGQVVLHWPQGKKFQMAGHAGESQMQVRIRKDRDWFAASGKLVVNDDLSIDMMKLIELVEDSSSRFVTLDDGRVLALSEQLRRRVEEMGVFGDRLKNKMRFPAVRSAAIEEISDSLNVTTDKHWKDCLTRIREAGEVCPDVPSTLQTELRDYQVDGFRWLARLAHWGAGACLADDMGLGKTIQALALLLHRDEGGPALVVAPTSVTFNWMEEAARFAPTLNIRQFGNGDRDECLKDLGPRDVVVLSYGLLHFEAERFEKIDWHTAILDEAQAIKNTATKRSQAAMALSADFRVIMTGTPVENHLGELWNLFRFINPGLLGSQKLFNERFAGPIERDSSKGAKLRLKKLVQPFILRRTKSKVLQELPSRTEITLSVELTEEEAAFYEAIRRRAVEKLTEVSPDDKKQPQHLTILAEIMRLRRACCHPQLVMPESDLSSSKLKLFGDTIDELLAGKHKVLVFSQFVDHLSILRQELEQRNVAYQYLDGQTPVKQRQKRVNAFQSGDGDVFLISLKAGGTGLNLTAADYVIHMDPWWNPAVEDQAADRAHRIGQQRPVTIYRLITKGTIEEQIVELHSTKRDLADSLLEGTDSSRRLSLEELLAMLKG
jgi:superfamily II DNA or RNA helicase